MHRFNDLADCSAEEINSLLALAARLDAKPEPRALEGKVLSLLFLSPSLRTLSSFQAAMIRLGGGAFVISPEMSIHGLEITLRHRHGRRRRGARARSRSGDRFLRRRDGRPSIRRTARPRARPRRQGLQRTHSADRQALDQHGVGDSSSMPEPRGLEDHGRARYPGERRPVRVVLGVSSEGAPARRAVVDGIHGRRARHGRRRTAPARVSSCRRRSWTRRGAQRVCREAA